jgi:NAD-dependent SIR2 family protein deacetylase
VAVSKCVKCENTIFEIVEKEPNNARFKMMFVQCAKCGGVVGVTDYTNVPRMIKNLEGKLGEIEKIVKRLD